MSETKNDKSEQLHSEYQTKAALYDRLCRALVTQIQQLLEDARIVLAFAISYRVKTWQSIVEKCQRNNLNPDSLDDVPDVAGLRIVTLFQRDASLAGEIIDENLLVIGKENTQERLGEREFGYGSVHYEVRAPDDWGAVPTMRPLIGLRAEIQVRSASQHIWAAASHTLQYKRESHVPIPLRRTINRVAALLVSVLKT